MYFLPSPFISFIKMASLLLRRIIYEQCIAASLFVPLNAGSLCPTVIMGCLINGEPPGCGDLACILWLSVLIRHLSLLLFLVLQPFHLKAGHVKSGEAVYRSCHLHCPQASVPFPESTSSLYSNATGAPL